jgi:AcrR family transcriptional regulator
MGRPRTFNREEVLEEAMKVFWRRGFADTGMHDLELATGVNKSGLYAEFKDKNDLFLSALKYYQSTRKARALLSVEPLGWDNIERYLRQVESATREGKGCFNVSTLRDLALLPPEVREAVLQNRAELKALFAQNVQAAMPHRDAEPVTEIVATFFSGLCIEQSGDLSDPGDKVGAFMKVLRSL